MDTIKKIIKETIESQAGETVKESLDEALVHEKKLYGNHSRFVSEKTKEIHKELYDKYVESFNKSSAELDGIAKDYSDDSIAKYMCSKKGEQRSSNAIYLHELFFSNCFCQDSEIFSDSLSFIMLQREWGTFDAWQKDFISCALASNGWAVTGYSFFYQKLTNIMINDHTHNALVGFYPLIVVDVWEHATRDYKPSQKKDYVFRMMSELDWDVIDERFSALEAMLKKRA